MILGASARTHEVFRNIRSLQQAQVQFTDGWVQDLEVFQVDEEVPVRSKVNHSMRLSQKPPQPWVVLKSSGEVEGVPTAHVEGAFTCPHDLLSLVINRLNLDVGL